MNRADIIDKLDLLLHNIEFFEYPEISKEKVKKDIRNIKKMKKYIARNELDKVFGEDEVEEDEDE